MECHAKGPYVVDLIIFAKTVGSVDQGKTKKVPLTIDIETSADPSMTEYVMSHGTEWIWNGNGQDRPADGRAPGLAPRRRRSDRARASSRRRPNPDPFPPPFPLKPARYRLLQTTEDPFLGADGKSWTAMAIIPKDSDGRVVAVFVVVVAAAVVVVVVVVVSSSCRRRARPVPMETRCRRRIVGFSLSACSVGDASSSRHHRRARPLAWFRRRHPRRHVSRGEFERRLI